MKKALALSGGFHQASEVTVGPDCSLREAVRKITSVGFRACLIVGDGQRLLGIVTDADLRKALLAGATLDVNITEVMNRHPLVGQSTSNAWQREALMRRHGVSLLPIVDDDGRLVDLETLSTVISWAPRANDVVLMAGGRGSRLASHTANCPKPLLNVGRKPLLETIVESFLEQGFHRFWISIHYLSEMVERHFGDGGRWGAQIRYLRETEPLGTAGALSLLDDRPTRPIVVMNGDILTRLDFSALVDHHESCGNDVTLCVYQHETTIPYGVVELENGLIKGIREKPAVASLISAGIYVLSPHVLGRLHPNQRREMPDLLDAVARSGGRVGAYPITEYWLDIGRIEDFERANRDYWSHFT